jgi:DNA repair exonuclease SbcCD ATPase subunit
VTDVTRKLLANTKGELPTSQAKAAKAGNPVCPICSVPIDKVLAEGCKITLESCNLDELNKQVEEKRKVIKSQEADVSKLEGEAKNLKIELALAKQSFEQADKTLKALEASRDKNTNAFQSAQRLIDDTSGYARQLEERVTTAAALAKAERRLKEARDNLAKHRESARGVVSLLSERFNHVVTSVVQNKTNGEVQLDGNGLSLMVNRDGDLSTAAIDSVKVLAFDVASMLLAIEGKARLPSFFVHDSPREADLGQSIYDRLFRTYP